MPQNPCYRGRECLSSLSILGAVGELPEAL